jgi:acetate kinase
MDNILVVNAGSSSLKFQIFTADGDQSLEPFIKGQIDGIGSRPKMRATSVRDSKSTEEILDSGEVPNVARAIEFAGKWLRAKFALTPTAVGHRVVHGGPAYDRPILVNDKVLSELDKLVALAPLHQPNNLAAIRAIRERFPTLPQVACFDTAFHRGHDPVAEHFAIPEKFYVEGVRRYGFHGLSYEYVAGRLREVAPGIADKRIIVAHLGSGASMCALLNGKSVESTMGFTALDGLPMGTRPGQIDPGVLIYLMIDKGMSVGEVQNFLYSECGLKGLSGVSNDVRELLESSASGAKLALDHFIYRIGLSAGMLAAAIGGLDAFVFTAGIGERSPVIRAGVVERLAWLGAELDQTANNAGSMTISTAKSGVDVLVVPTDEELMIARHTMATLVAKPAHV